MDATFEMKAMTRKEWHKFNEYGTVVLTDIAPADVVKDYNDYVVHWINYLFKDYVVHPKQFYEMRTRIGYNIDQILEEMKTIYKAEEIEQFKTERKL